MSASFVKFSEPSTEAARRWTETFYSPERTSRYSVAEWVAFSRQRSSAARSRVRQAIPTMVGESVHEASSKLRNFCTNECILYAE